MKILFYIFIFSLNIFAQPPSDIHKILDTYQKQKTITMRIKKTFTQPLLKKTTTSEGHFYLSHPFWRLELSSPQKNIILYDGQKIFYIQGSTLHHIPSSEIPVLHLLFDTKEFYKSFKYLSQSQKGRTSIYTFQGLKASNPEKIHIQIEKDRILSLRVQWPEPLGEEYFRLSSIFFNQKIDKKLFKPLPTEQKTSKKML